MASEIRVNKINSRTGVGTITLSPTGVDFTGIATASTLRATTGIITTLQVGTISGDGSSLTGIAATDNVRTGILDVAGVGTFRNDVNIPDKIIHLGDTDTAIRFPAANTFTVETAGSEAIRVDSSQRLLIGSTSGRSAGDVTAQLQVEGTSFSTASLNLISNAGTSAGNVPHITLGKSRGTSDGSSTVVADDDNLGSIQWAGADGTDLNSTAALISAAVDGSPGSNDMPGRLMFHTTADGASSPTERLRIDSSGRLLVGHSSLTGDSDSAYSKFVVNGNTQATSKGGILSLENTAATIGSISNNNQIGQVFFKAETGEEFGQIKVEAQGDPSSTSCPGRMMFCTTTSSTTTPTERLRIAHDGQTTFRPADYGLGVRSVAGSSSVNTAYFGAHSSTSMSTGSITFEVYTNGNVKNSNNSYGQLSDERLKENIVNAPSQWDDIKSLQIRKYNFRDGNGYETHTQIGLVAQEVEAVSPGLVQETPVREDATPVLDAEGNELEATKSVLTSVLYMKAVKALQEAQTRIETLETQNTAQQTQINDLITRVTALEG